MMKAGSLLCYVSVVPKLRVSASPTLVSSAFQHRPSGVCINASTNFNTSTTHDIPISAYVHLPFCRKRCYYCDFPIIALGRNRLQSSTLEDSRMLDYVNLLIREIKATETPSGDYPPLQTIYFGGGTPSLVSPRLVHIILDALRSKFGICLNPEISFEMDPGTFDAIKLKELMELGVNRVSLGVQAFQEDLLRSCGRAHGVKEARESIEIIGLSGLKNWSLDLISSLPHQTAEMWKESLDLAIGSAPTHISVYDLQVEQGTKFGLWYKPGESPLPSENQSALFYQMASKTLSEASFHHYEISNYCKEGYESQHNLTYWSNQSFYGFGLGSASYINGIRFSRPRKLKEYIAFIENIENGLLNPHENPRNGDSMDMAMDIVMLSLRTARGLSVKSFGRNFGWSLVLSLLKVFEPYVESGHVIVLDGKKMEVSVEKLQKILFGGDEEVEKMVGFLRLSDPNGFLLSNELISLAFRVISP